MSLISRSYVLDLSPGTSFVEALRDQGFDTYMLDWGIPDERDAGNGLEHLRRRAVAGGDRGGPRRPPAPTRST